VWSLGITAIELADGVTPTNRSGNRWHNPFFLLSNIVVRPAPTLCEVSRACWSASFQSFVAECLQKNPSDRASAATLASHPFVARACVELQAVDGCSTHVAGLVRRVAQWTQQQQQQRREAAAAAAAATSGRVVVVGGMPTPAAAAPTASIAAPTATPALRHHRMSLSYQGVETTPAQAAALLTPARAAADSCSSSCCEVGQDDNEAGTFLVQRKKARVRSPQDSFDWLHGDDDLVDGDSDSDSDSDANNESAVKDDQDDAYLYQ
jgi:hypothetical protein